MKKDYKDNIKPIVERASEHFLHDPREGFMIGIRTTLTGGGTHTTLLQPLPLEKLKELRKLIRKAIKDYESK